MKQLRAFLFPWRETLSCDNGGSIVEFALVVPLMMLLITGMFSIGIMLNSYIMLTNGVNAGARAFALSRGVYTSSTTKITDPCAYAVQAAKQAAPNLNSSASTISITWTPSGGSATTYTTGTCNGVAIASGDTVQLQATYPVTMIVYGWTGGRQSISQQTTELVQ